MPAEERIRELEKSRDQLRGAVVAPDYTFASSGRSRERQDGPPVEVSAAGGTCGPRTPLEVKALGGRQKRVEYVSLRFELAICPRRNLSFRLSSPISRE